MRQGRLISTGLATIVAVAIIPATAAAAPSPLTDDDFAGGTPGAATWVVEPGLLRLAPEVRANYDGAALAAGWTSAPWNSGGAGSVASGVVRVDGARVNTAEPAALGPGRVLEFRATFASVAHQHLGFAVDFNDGPWAMFSTGGGGAGLFARASSGPGMPSTDVPIPGVDPLLPHTYRVEWTPTEVRFLVDGAPATTIPVVIAGPMRPVASDLHTVASDATTGAAVLTVDWIGVSPLPATGVFESRVLEADDARAVWGPLAATGGADATFETRSGVTAASLSEWQPVGASGAVASPPGRFIQYRATLATSDPDSTPSVDGVTIPYTIDTVAPTASIDGVVVSGATATVKFSSPAADVGRFECSVDGGPFATCATPIELTGLAAGSHTVSVRAVDRAGNTGEPVSETFGVASAAGAGTPPPTVGSTTPPAPVVAADTTAPRVTLGARSIRAGKRAGIRLTCPDDEPRCFVSVFLKRGSGAVAARKSAVLAGGESRTLRLRLSRAARERLATRRRMNVVAVVVVRDATGNQRRTTHAMTLKRGYRMPR